MEEEKQEPQVEEQEEDLCDADGYDQIAHDDMHGYH